MEKNNVHNFRKIPGWLSGKIIKVISYFNHSLYMKFYIRHLKKRGMDFQGEPIYIGSTTEFDGKDFSKIHIGDKTVISSQVRFLTHDYSISRALVAAGENLDKEVFFVKDIYVGKNCFIGTRSIIMPGTILGDNVIVGAGSVVRGKIPNNSIVIGNPATVIGNTIEWAKNKVEKKEYFTNN